MSSRLSLWVLPACLALFVSSCGADSEPQRSSPNGDGDGDGDGMGDGDGDGMGDGDGDGDGCEGDDCGPIELEGVAFGESKFTMEEPGALADFFNPVMEALIEDGSKKLFMLQFPEGIDPEASTAKMFQGIGARVEGTDNQYEFTRTGESAFLAVEGLERVWKTASFKFVLNFAVPEYDLTIPFKLSDAVFRARLTVDGKKLEGGDLKGFVLKKDLEDTALPPGCGVAFDCGSCAPADVKNVANLLECHGVETDPTNTGYYHVAFKLEESIVTAVAAE